MRAGTPHASRTSQAWNRSVRRSAVATALAMPLLASVAACSGVQQANQNLEQAQQAAENLSACAKAVGAVQFMPDFTNPEQAATKAKQKLKELEQLTAKTANEKLKQQLRDVQESVQKVANGEITLEESGQWVASHINKAQKVLTTCSGMAN